MSKSQRTHLLTLAHNMKPVVWIGQNGLTDAVRLEFEQALAHHELLKVKVSIKDRLQRQEIIEDLAANADAQCLRTIGQIAILFKRAPEKSRIVFPE